MKKSLLVLIIAAAVVSCKNSEPKVDGFVVNGNAAGVYNGIRAYLKIKDERGRDMVLDSAIIFDEKFTFKGFAYSPEIKYLSVNSIPGDLPIIIENGNITVTIDKTNLQDSKIEGSKSNDALTAYNAATKVLNTERFELNKTARELRTSTDTVSIRKNNLQIKENSKKITEYPFEFIPNHRDNYFSLILLETLLKDPNTDFEKVNTLFESMDNGLKISPLGIKVSAQLFTIKKESERETNLNIGKIAPQFSAPDVNGNIIALNDIKGKVTIIDFWAAWCGPCRRENPNVVNVYNKYHSKGLEIIGVSLDGSPTQHDAKAAWAQAIKDDNLTWHNVSNLQYFNDPVAQLYNIKSIPATYILDRNGVIVAKNLRGAALEAKIEELLK